MRGKEGDNGNYFVPCAETFEKMKDFVRMVNQFNSSVLRVFLLILRDKKRTFDR